MSQAASAASGTIESFVQDESGVPVAGAVVSATGASTVFGVTDRLGQVTLRSLPPGPYLVRAHISGFTASRGQTVQVLPSTRASSSIALHRVTPPGAGSTPPIVPASIGGLGEAVEPSSREAEPPVAASGDAGDKPKDGEIEWRLRHARRSILNEAVDQVMVADASPVRGVPGNGGYVDRGRSASSTGGAAHVASSFFSETPFFGQVNLLTTSSFEAPLDLFTTRAFVSRSVANVLLGAPVGDRADWTVRGALTQGDIASWVVFGDYVTRAQARHRYDIGLSYSTQRYDGGNFAALRNVTDGSRNVGTMHGFDTFAVTPAVTVTYGTRYAHYDYLEGTNLLSPRVGLVLTPEKHMRVNALVSLRALAPGAQEFMPPADTGIWLPPQRTFSAAIDGRPLVAERTLHLEAGIEHDLSSATTVSVRAFSQYVDNQLVTLFTREMLGHYFVGSSGRIMANGYAAGVKTVIAERVHGSVEYSFARAERNALDTLTYLVLVGADIGRTHPRAGARSLDVHRNRGAGDVHAGRRPLPPERRLRPARINGRLRPRSTLRRPGASGAPVHGLQLRQVGNARGGPQLLPRCGDGSVNLRRTARGPVPQTRGGRADAQVLIPSPIHNFGWRFKYFGSGVSLRHM